MALQLRFQGSDGISDDEDDDITFHELNLMANYSDKERQIAVDPISLIWEEEEPSSSSSSSSSASSFRSIGGRRRVLMDPPEMPAPLPPLKPPHHHFLMTTSFSLPGSASSSPRFSSALSKKNVIKTTTKTTTTTKNALQLDQYLQRSKSCGEGRWFAPPDDLDDILFSTHRGPPPPPTSTRLGRRRSSSSSQVVVVPPPASKDADDHDQGQGFRGCGAGICLYLLPGSGKGSKGQVIKSRRRAEVGSSSSSSSSGIGSVISRAVSLERFECGSWASSSAIIPDHLEYHFNNQQQHMYFDLPMELIRNSMDDDATSPVASAFLFHSVVLAKSDGSGRKPHQLRPSRFSARDDLDALLHAHNSNM